jgi:hypothetical protein
MTKLLASAVLVVFLLAVAPRGLKAGPLCPLRDATKHGTYRVYGTGTVVGVGPAVALGEITYDGHGNAVATFTLNVNGNVQTHTNVPSTYTVNSDCTGTAFEAGAHYSFVTSPDGNVTTWMETDPGSVVSGTEVRLNPVEEGEEAQVHPNNGLAGPASRRPVTLQSVNFRSRTDLVGRRLSSPSRSL